MIEVVKYQCGVCKHVYVNRDDALACESTPITHDKHVKAGDRVRLVGGTWDGEIATVLKICLGPTETGKVDYYGHSVYIKTNLPAGGKYRYYDGYEPIKNEEGDK